MQKGGELGSSVAVNATFTVAGVSKDDIGEDDAGVAKVFDTATGALLFVLTNPEPESFDRFGFSVALNGSILVVGTPGFDGGAYVYDLSGATPTVSVHVLDNPSPTGDGFGISVAISGARVVVGAHRDDTGAPDSGAVYVYDLASGTPTVPLHTLNNPGPFLGDLFGNSVSVSGSLVVVGAPNDDTGGANAGSAYAYDLGSGTPTVPVLTLTNPSPPLGGSQFGFQLNSLNDLIVAIAAITAAQIDGVLTIDPTDPALAGVTVIDNTLHFTFSLPRGFQGLQGIQGNPGIPGADVGTGPQGPPFANAVVDAVNTLPAGSAATVTVSFDGTLTHLVFNIPAGADGAPGEVSDAELATAIADTSGNSNAVGTMDTPFTNDPPTLAELELMRAKYNELVLALRRA